MSPLPPSDPAPQRGRVPIKRAGCWIFTSFVFMFMIGSVYSIVQSGVKDAEISGRLQVAHELGLSLYSYAQDHGGKYPSGKSSTEVFQQLIDGKYLTDPTVLYVSGRGKIAVVGTVLKPENVCWDITDGAQADDSESLPLVFTTGYQVHYTPNGDATPLLAGDRYGSAVFYVNNAARFFPNGADGVVHRFVGETLDTKGKTYRQLTPDGPLSPSP